MTDWGIYLLILVNRFVHYKTFVNKSFEQIMQATLSCGWRAGRATVEKKCQNVSDCETDKLGGGGVTGGPHFLLPLFLPPVHFLTPVSVHWLVSIDGAISLGCSFCLMHSRPLALQCVLGSLSRDVVQSLHFTKSHIQHHDWDRLPVSAHSNFKGLFFPDSPVFLPV